MVSIFFFGLGIFLQSLYQIKDLFVTNRSKLRYIPLCLLLSLFGFVIDKDLADSISAHLLFVFIGYCGTFAWFYKDKVLSPINEQILLHMTLIGYYVIFSSPLFQGMVKEAMLLLFLLPSVLIIYLCFVETSISFGWRVFLYIFYFIMNSIIISSYFSFGILSIFYNSGTSLGFQPVPLLIAGATFFSLVANLTYLYQLLPLKGRDQTYEERMKEIKQFATFLSLEYEDDQLEPVHTMFILIIQGGILLGNYFFKIIPDLYVITLSLFLSQGVVLLFTKTQAPVEPKILSEVPVE